MFDAREYTPGAPGAWKGRDDRDEGERAIRWHQRVELLDLRTSAPRPGEAVLLGFASDAGVARNQGRIGASAGPSALRGALAGLAWHIPGGVRDAGEVVCQGDALEEAQEALGRGVAEVLRGGGRPVVLGGGHEVAFGTWQGVEAWSRAQARPPTVGIVNFDAHFDLRAGRASSGTPFRQIAEGCAADGRRFAYACLGVASVANTAALFDRASQLGVTWLLDEELAPWRLDKARSRLAGFLASVDRVQLSVCLDVLPASVAPGVSAPAARGVGLAVVEALLDDVVASGKVLAAEVAELNPRHDPDGRTARVAARLVERIVRGG